MTYAERIGVIKLALQDLVSYRDDGYEEPSHVVDNWDELACAADAACLKAIEEPTEEMRLAYGGALKQYIDGLPAEERERRRAEWHNGYHVGKARKVLLRWSAMHAAIPRGDK